MKILKIRAEGLPLYKRPLELCFYAQQRLSADRDEPVTRLFSNIAINSAVAFVGINASGKSTVLKVISLVSSILRAESLHSESSVSVLGEGIPAVFDIVFLADNNIYNLRSEVLRTKSIDGNDKVKFLSEQLWRKSASSKVNKANLLDFEGLTPVRDRDQSGEYLPNDVSIMIAVNKELSDYTPFFYLDMLTNFNFLLPIEGTAPKELVTLLDPSIEYIALETDKDEFIGKLKFYGKEEIIGTNISTIEACLSSGTIKGFNLFGYAMYVLRFGGYLLIDEIENHFNRALVASLLELFTNKKTNPNGAVIIFSTHYPELLDELDRNDSVFITRNTQGLTVENLSTLLKRNDMKKSEVYRSDYLGGTAPSYDAWTALKKNILNAGRAEDD